MRGSLEPAMRRARDGNERLWKIWWLLGIPVGWAMSALALGSEALRSAGYHGSGDVVDVVKLLFYTFWFQLAWRCSHNVETWAEAMPKFLLWAFGR